MNEQPTQTQSVVIDRELPHPPEKVWRALTQSNLIDQWLMKNDFKPEVSHRFKFNADWGSVDGQVLAVEPVTRLSYAWVAYGLETIVTYTLTPIDSGTHLRMEQSGFPVDMLQAINGAKYGWTKFLTSLDEVVAGLD